jgi:hypothetical protein
MANHAITLADTFETLIAQAGFGKASLARAAGIDRQIIFRAINPEAYNVGGTLRMDNAWRIARAYADRTGITHDTAFALLFVVAGEDPPAGRALGTADTAPGAVPVAPLGGSDLRAEPTEQEPLGVPPSTPGRTLHLRFDGATLTMLEALMQDEDRISERDMLRSLITRAYRALVAQRSMRDSTLPSAPTSDPPQEETP